MTLPINGVRPNSPQLVDADNRTLINIRTSQPLTQRSAYTRSDEFKSFSERGLFRLQRQTMLQLESKQNSFQAWVPETDLIARASKNDPEVVMVSMFQTLSVDVPVGQRRQIFTYGLGGCTAVAVVFKHPDGRRSFTLSHHPPTSTDQQVKELRMELFSKHALGDIDVKHEAFIVTPGVWARDGDGNWSMHAEQQDVVEKLSDEMQARLPGVQCKVLPYSKAKKGTGQSSAFVLQVPANASEAIRYQGIHYGQCEI